MTAASPAARDEEGESEAARKETRARQCGRGGGRGGGRRARSSGWGRGGPGRLGARPRPPKRRRPRSAPSPRPGTELYLIGLDQRRGRAESLKTTLAQWACDAEPRRLGQRFQALLSPHRPSALPLGSFATGAFYVIMTHIAGRARDVCVLARGRHSPDSWMRPPDTNPPPPRPNISSCYSGQCGVQKGFRGGQGGGGAGAPLSSAWEGRSWRGQGPGQVAEGPSKPVSRVPAKLGHSRSGRPGSPTVSPRNRSLGLETRSNKS